MNVSAEDQRAGNNDYFKYIENELMLRSFTDFDALDAEIARQFGATVIVAELVKAAVKENSSTSKPQNEYLKKYNSHGQTL